MKTQAEIEDSAKTKKQLLQLASVAYHPDKNMNVENSDQGAQWHLLCGEIQKILNRFFDRMKGVD